jgi:hypothetical protein
MCGGLSGASFIDMAYKYVDLRTKGLFFDLSLFEQPLDRDSLRQLLQSYPPCPIVHDTKFDGSADLFNNWSVNQQRKFNLLEGNKARTVIGESSFRRRGVLSP